MTTNPNRSPVMAKIMQACSGPPRPPQCPNCEKPAGSHLMGRCDDCHAARVAERERRWADPRYWMRHAEEALDRKDYECAVEQLAHAIRKTRDLEKAKKAKGAKL